MLYEICIGLGQIFFWVFNVFLFDIKASLSQNTLFAKTRDKLQG